MLKSLYRKHFYMLKKTDRPPLFYTEEQLARLIGVSYRDLLRGLAVSNDYVEFKIPKRSGGERSIEKPSEELLAVQKAMDIWMRKYYRHPGHVHGFVKQRSIVTNAKEHIGKACVLNIDIKDFFGTITSQRVIKVFQRPPFNLHSEMASLIANLCCCDGRLPQGAPTSPIVSNIASWSLDFKLNAFAKKRGYSLTRYADDITISTQSGFFSPSVGMIEGNRFVLGEPLVYIIHKAGFQVNFEKVRLRFRRNRQEVTGIVVNEKANVTRRYVNQVRAMLHSLRMEGEELALQRHLQHRLGAHSQHLSSFPAIVRGKIEFIGMVRGKDDELYQRLLQELSLITSQSE